MWPRKFLHWTPKYIEPALHSIPFPTEMGNEKHFLTKYVSYSVVNLVSDKVGNFSGQQIFKRGNFRPIFFLRILGFLNFVM